MKDRLKVISLGLLEYSASGCWGLQHRGDQACAIVRYIHRTAFDFINSPEIKTSLLRHTAGTTFDPNTALLQGCIMRMKGKIDHALATDNGLIFSVITSNYSYEAFVQSENPDPILLHELLSVKSPKFSIDLSELLNLYVLSRNLQSDKPRHFDSHVLDNFLDGRLYPVYMGPPPRVRYAVWVQALFVAHKLSEQQPLQEHERAMLSNHARIIKAYVEHGDCIATLQLGDENRTARSIAMDAFRDHLPDEAETIDKIFAASGALMEISNEKVSRFQKWSKPGFFTRPSRNLTPSQPVTRR